MGVTEERINEMGKAGHWDELIAAVDSLGYDEVLALSLDELSKEASVVVYGRIRRLEIERERASLTPEQLKALRRERFTSHPEDFRYVGPYRTGDG